MAPLYEDRAYETEKAITVHPDTGEVNIAPPRNLKTPFGSYRIITDAAPRPGTYRWGIMKAKERVEERRRLREEKKKKEEDDKPEEEAKEEIL